MEAGGDGLPEPREQPAMNRRPIGARQPHAHGVKRARPQARLPESPPGRPKELSLGSLKPNLVGIRRAGLGLREDAPTLVGQRSRCASAAAVHAEEIWHRLKPRTPSAKPLITQDAIFERSAALQGGRCRAPRRHVTNLEYSPNPVLTFEARS